MSSDQAQRRAWTVRACGMIESIINMTRQKSASSKAVNCAFVGRIQGPSSALECPDSLGQL
jgi:hypothetical protein